MLTKKTRLNSRAPSTEEARFAVHIRAHGLPEPLREFQFFPSRLWRFDFAWREQMIAVEIEGVTGGAGGRHQRAQGYADDCQKYNLAALLGWRVYRFTQRQVKHGEAIELMALALLGGKQRNVELLTDMGRAGLRALESQRYARTDSV